MNTPALTTGHAAAAFELHWRGTKLSHCLFILGAEASNLALKVLATGGVYLGGGIPPRILPALADGRFMEAFLDKGRFADLLKDVPVHVILNPKVALMGAASYGLVMAA
jgi:glucokinase